MRHDYGSTLLITPNTSGNRQYHLLKNVRRNARNFERDMARLELDMGHS